MTFQTMVSTDQCKRPCSHMPLILETFLNKTFDKKENLALTIDFLQECISDLI